jgi:hypothetical protein
MADPLRGRPGNGASDLERARPEALATERGLVWGLCAHRVRNAISCSHC